MARRRRFEPAGAVPSTVVTFTSWPQRIGSAVSTAILGALVTGVAQAAQGDVGTVVGLLATIAGIGRSMVLGVTIEPARVTVRNLFRTRRIDASDVSRFAFRPAPWWTHPIEHQLHVIVSHSAPVPITVMALPVFERMQRGGRHRCAAMNRCLDEHRR